MIMGKTGSGRTHCKETLKRLTAFLQVHECLFHYKGTPNMKCPDRDALTGMGWREGLEECPGLWAVRCGPHKLHYVTKQWDTDPLFQDPPLIYQVENDPSETYPLDPTRYIQFVIGRLRN